MGRPLRSEYPGAFYHVASSGNGQKDIFKSEKDREQFIKYLESATVRYKDKKLKGKIEGIEGVINESRV